MKTTIKKFGLLLLVAAVGGAVMFACSKDKGGDNPNPGPSNDPSEVAKNSLIAYWAFNGNGNETVGNRAIQETTDSVTFIKGRRGQAYQGKTGAYIKFAVPDGDKFIGLKQFTVAFWMKSPRESHGMAGIYSFTDGATWNAPLLMGQDGGQDGIGLQMKAYFEKKGVSYAAQWFEAKTDAHNYLSNFPIDTWFHMVMRYDSATSICTILLNGGKSKIDTPSAYESPTRYASDPGDSTNVDNAPKLGALNLGFKATDNYGVIGYWANHLGGYDVQPWQSYFPGVLDEMRFYDRPLTDAEVKQLYDAEVNAMD